MKKATFWNRNHPLTPLAEELQKLIPMGGNIEGEENANLDKLRRLINVQHEMFNNGGCNLSALKSEEREKEQTIRAFLPVTVTKLKRMGDHCCFDEIEDLITPILADAVLAAAKEQGIPH